MSRRAEEQLATRRRIVEAALELHSTLGPARTPLSAVAERAGVQRHTLYAHFPEAADLFKACGAHFWETHPFPDVERWAAWDAGELRLRRALTEVYRYYGENTATIERVIRDMKLVPVGGGLRTQLARGAEILAQGWDIDRAGLRLALYFHTWEALAELGPARAARLMARMVAASRR